MATVTPATFRTAMYRRMKATAGVEFDDAQVDEAGAAAFNAAFPALYARSVQSSVVPTLNTNTRLSSIALADTSRVYKLADPEFDQDILGWRVKDATTIHRIPYEPKTVDVYSYAPINYPVTSVTVPDEWLDALYTYASLVLSESLLNDFAQFRGYKPNSREGQIDEVGLQNLITNLYNKWTRERDERHMVLPVVVV
jgi:hypothetical protein